MQHVDATKKPSRLRPYVTFAAGGVLIVLPALLWLGMNALLATHASSMTPEQQSVFASKSTAALGLIALSGVIAIANGTVMLRSGKPNVVLTLAMLGAFVAAAFQLSAAASFVN